MSVVIRVENLSKRYRLGVIGGTTLRDDLRRWWAGRRGLPNPLVKLGQVDRGESGDGYWALRDLSFEVRDGDILGIVGANGAGKSTLLKILSSITAPSSGEIRIRGRVGCLLEVGTGFHPELTGRENVYLNGAILGMTKSEIARKFDEIVDFSGIEEFLDTPVKRYSSGMQVRLAFAVAAHLDPEILIVDEVLAVGDAEFQKRCLGKMKSVANEGRTVLFVSHNMQAVSQLTTRCMLLQNGSCVLDGAPRDVVQEYLSAGAHASGNEHEYRPSEVRRGNHVAAARVITSADSGVHHWGEPLAFEFDLAIPSPTSAMTFSFQVVDEEQRPICHLGLFDPGVPYRVQPGLYRIRCDIPKSRLYMGSYTVTTWLADRRSNDVDENLQGICEFEVSMVHTHRPEYAWAPGTCTYIEDATWSPVASISDVAAPRNSDRSPAASATV